MNYGVQRLLDQHQRVLRSAFPIYLRIKNFIDTQSQMWSQLGFSIAPTGAPAGSSNSPFNYTFAVGGVGTVHSITVGPNTYLYSEVFGETTASLALAMTTAATTATGVPITDDPFVALTVVSGPAVQVAPSNNSGAVIGVSGSDLNLSTLLWVTNSPTGTLVATAGTTDILITPPPNIEMVSTHNIGQSMGKLRFGARIVTVSQGFVAQQAMAQNLPDQNLVWRGPQVVGLVSENLLFSIENVDHSELTGNTVFWYLTCNVSELRVSGQVPILNVADGR